MALQARSQGGTDGIGNLFTAPDAVAKIMGNPTTRAFMQQPDFVSMFTVRAERGAHAASL